MAAPRAQGAWRLVRIARVKLVVQQALVDLMADVNQRVPVLCGDAAFDPEGVVDRGLGSDCCLDHSLPFR